jgi:hypothetical protein
VPPSAVFSAPSPVIVGQPILLALSGASGPSSTSFDFAFDCGNGAGFGAFGANNTASCATSAAGLRTVRGRVRDQNGLSTEYALKVTVVVGTPLAATAPATNVTLSSAKLNGMVNAQGSSVAVSFQWGTTPGGPYPNTAAATPGTASGTSGVAVSANLSGLSPSMSVYYRVVAGAVAGNEQRFTTLIPPFPRTPVLDNFNRANGKLGPNWSGEKDDYRIRNQQVVVLGDDTIYWQAGNPLGVNQEVFATFVTIDPNGPEQGLLLKVQGGAKPSARLGAISVVYDASANKGAGGVRVETRGPSQTKWTNCASLPVKFRNGDQIGARALANGEVWIFKNGVFVGKVVLSAADQAFFNNKGGRIGLNFNGSPRLVFDDFGGGTTTP